MRYRESRYKWFNCFGGLSCVEEEGKSKDNFLKLEILKDVWMSLESVIVQGVQLNTQASMWVGVKGIHKWWEGSGSSL
jgi:hypothetical protein